MKKFFLLISCLFISLSAQNTKDLPVPAGEPERTIDLQDKDVITLETFEELIQKASEESPFILAEVVTTSPESQRTYYHYFEASSIDSFQKDPLSNILNPLNQLPIQKIYYYKLSAPENAFVFDRAVDIPIQYAQPTPVQVIPEGLQELLDTLPGQPSAANRFYVANQFLNLSHLQLQEIPEAFFTQLANLLPNLQRIDLADNQLTTIPDSIDNLGNLQLLDLAHNQLTTIPDSIGNLDNLQELSLGHNQLKTVPDTIGNLDHLQLLFLYDNQLTTIPDSIGNLGDLQILSLYNNKLTTIPDTIGNLANLQILYLYNNQLTTIPGTMDNLGNLQRLYLYDNQLTTIPDTIGNLDNLKMLSLSHNRLTTVPDTIGNLTNLQTLTLFNNPQLQQTTQLENLLEQLRNRNVEVIID